MRGIKNSFSKMFRRKNRTFVYILFVVLIIYFSFFSFMYFNYNDWGKSGTLGDTFGILNALFSSIGTAGIIYTLYLQNKTFEVGIRPLLAIQGRVTKNNTYLELKVKNIGNGTAINIDIVPSILDIDISLFNYKQIHFRKIDNKKFYLQADIEETVYMNAYNENNELVNPMFLSILDERYSNFTIDFKVTYQDVSSKHITQNFSLGINDGSIKID